MQAYYINLDTAIARMNSIKSCISNAALPFEFARFNALRGDFSEINFGNYPSDKSDAGGAILLLLSRISIMMRIS